MADITLKNVPDELYLQLKSRTEFHLRSLDQEAIMCLELALQNNPIDAGSILERARKQIGGQLNDEDLLAMKNEAGHDRREHECDRIPSYS